MRHLFNPLQDIPPDRLKDRTITSIKSKSLLDLIPPPPPFIPTLSGGGTQGAGQFFSVK
jgi:hypothetical protein